MSGRPWLRQRVPWPLHNPYSQPDRSHPGTAHRGPAQDPIRGIREVHVDAEFGANRGHQLAQQARPGRGRLDRRRGHSCTSRPVNQPAASNARRASSTVRCP